jgi:hypothetical protein
MSVARGTNNKLHPIRALRKGLGRDRRLRRHFFCLARAPVTSLKSPTLSAYFCLARGISGKTGSHEASNRGTRGSSRRWDGHDHAQSIAAREPRPDPTWPRSFHHHDIHTSTTTRVTTTIPPNSLSTQIWAPVPPVLDGIEAHRTKHSHSV